ncbi:MAG TPA: hypothetical protein VNX68_02610, partial [Nitrosopumilaceae archaeon]|nr:hypothetical protein [Nitrosopumilaceae archaeon]
DLKGFTWKNEAQNRFVSGLIMYTQLRGILCTGKPELVEDSLMPKEQKIQQMFKNGYMYNLRNFVRYTPSVDFDKEIKRLGFQEHQYTTKVDSKSEVYYTDIFKNNELDFRNKSDLHIYYAFASYSSIGTEGKTIFIYFPAANIIEYKLRLTADGYPQFDKKNWYVSLFDKKMKGF